jgi:hypothetical protein
MKKKLSFLTIILIVSLLVTTTSAQVTNIIKNLNPTIRLNEAIDSGFRDYIRQNKLAINSENAQQTFAAFLHKNPTYQASLSQYIKDTTPDINSVLPAIPISEIVSVGPVTQTETKIINNRSYTVEYRQALLADGRELTKVVFHGEGVGIIDPYIYARSDPIIGYYAMQQIQVGEIGYFAVGYPATNPDTGARDAADMRQQIYDKLFYSSLFGGLIDTASAGLLGKLNPYLGIAASIVGDIPGGMVQYAQDEVNHALDDDGHGNGNGLWVCIQNKYIFPMFSFWEASTVDVYVKRWDLTGSPWHTLFPFYAPYVTVFSNYLPPTNWMASEQNSYSLSVQIKDWATNRLQQPVTDFQWVPGSPDAPSVPDNIAVTFTSVNLNTNSYVDGAGVTIDGIHVGDTPSTVYLVQATHEYYTSPTWHLYENGYMFTGYESWGNQNIQYIELTSAITITANYVETQYLTITATEYSTGCVWGANFYIDSHMVGAGTIALEVPKGSHYITSDSQASHYGELVTCDSIWVGDQQVYDNNIYIGDAPVSITFGYHFGW